MASNSLSFKCRASDKVNFFNWPQIISELLLLNLNSKTKIYCNSSDNFCKFLSKFIKSLLPLIPKKLIEGFFKKTLAPKINLERLSGDIADPKLRFESTGSIIISGL